MIDPLQSEFDLHVSKRSATAERPEQYLIGVWEGAQIRGLCHIADINEAMAVLRKTLESAGRPVAVEQQR
jgi:hypothetical protein